MNGYSEEGFEEWVEAERIKNPPPPWVDIIMMENDLGIPNRKLRTSEPDKAWAYFNELKAKLDQQQRKTA
jgi:hypothetical protein